MLREMLNALNPSARCSLQEHYGKSSKEAVAAVKALYRELDLEQVFLQYEQVCITLYPSCRPLALNKQAEPYTNVVGAREFGYHSKQHT